MMVHGGNCELKIRHTVGGGNCELTMANIGYITSTYTSLSLREYTGMAIVYRKERSDNNDPDRGQQTAKKHMF